MSNPLGSGQASDGTDPLIASLTTAVESAPADVPLRLHLAGLLVQRGRRDEAVAHCAAALTHDPLNARARELMAAALAAPGSAVSDEPADRAAPADRGAPADGSAASEEPAAGPGRATGPSGAAREFDWQQAESDLGSDVQPMFVDDAAEPSSGSAWDAEATTVTLSDVGGMAHVKDRLNAAFLAPMRNPELMRLYGKSLRGGLLLYGPPGCGKTFLARAVAGELGAKFISVGLADVLDMYLGQSERNLHELFQFARREAPVVLFLDEVNALGQKRSAARGTGMRGAVNQLLTELDGVQDSNDGVFVLGATNQPWDLDPALRRPGRFDRTLLVLPPDQEAREAILTYHPRSRPVEGIDVRRIARGTEGYSGADLAHLCDTAAERALLDGVRTGTARMIGMADLEAGLKEVRPSIGPWMQSARNVVEYGGDDEIYTELRTYLKKHRFR